MKFGEKDVVNGKITYKYADMCRKYDECGVEGKFYEKYNPTFSYWL
jgi:hypothetical protein